MASQESQPGDDDELGTDIVHLMNGINNFYSTSDFLMYSNPHVAHKAILGNAI